MPCSTTHDTLLLSFVGQTLYLRLDGEEVSEIPEVSGFVTDEQTIHAANVIGGQLLQVTGSGVRLVHDSQLKDCWTPDEGSVNLCAVNMTQGRDCTRESRERAFIRRRFT